MEGTRRHDEKMALASSMEGLAERGKFIVSGKNGQSMLGFFGDAIEQNSKSDGDDSLGIGQNTIYVISVIVLGIIAILFVALAPPKIKKLE